MHLREAFSFIIIVPKQGVVALPNCIMKTTCMSLSIPPTFSDTVVIHWSYFNFINPMDYMYSLSMQNKHNIIGNLIDNDGIKEPLHGRTPTNATRKAS